MTSLVSIITPVYPPLADYIGDTHRSVLEQDMPPDWDWEWIVQEDGQTGALSTLLPPEPRIKPLTGRRGGAAVARIQALARSDGTLIKSLDADDMLTPGALARDIAVLASNPNIGWVASRVLDLLPDGSTAGFEHDPPEGRIIRGSVLRHWTTHDYRAQVHPATLCVRRELILSVGGWTALPASSDTGLLMALDAVSDGYFIAEPGLLYRKWEGQVTNQPAHTDPAERDARMRLIEQRAHALVELAAKWSPHCG